MTNYELIGRPRVEPAYSDVWETVMVCDVRRADGVTGDVWIVAGVPDHQRGSSEAAGTQYGYRRARVFGDSPDSWCPACFDPADAAAIVEACEAAALSAHEAARGAAADGGAQ